MLRDPSGWWTSTCRSGAPPSGGSYLSLGILVGRTIQTAMVTANTSIPMSVYISFSPWAPVRGAILLL